MILLSRLLLVLVVRLIPLMSIQLWRGHLDRADKQTNVPQIQSTTLLQLLSNTLLRIRHLLFRTLSRKQPLLQFVKTSLRGKHL